jgi:hypothetical protein
MSDPSDELIAPASPLGGTAYGHSARGAALHRIPELIAEVYRSATAPLRTRLLEYLLQPVGPLGLVAIAAGAFGAILHRGGYRQLSVSPEDAARISADQMLELARYVEQCDPQALEHVASLLAESPAGMAGLGGSVLLFAMQSWRARKRAD